MKNQFFFLNKLVPFEKFCFPFIRRRIPPYIYAYSSSEKTPDKSNYENGERAPKHYGGYILNANENVIGLIRAVAQRGLKIFISDLAKHQSPPSHHRRPLGYPLP